MGIMHLHRPPLLKVKPSELGRLAEEENI